MKNIATVLIPEHETAVETCRLLVAEAMDNGEDLHPEDNVTELVYALRKEQLTFSKYHNHYGLYTLCPSCKSMSCI